MIALPSVEEILSYLCKINIGNPESGDINILSCAEIESLQEIAEAIHVRITGGLEVQNEEAESTR